MSRSALHRTTVLLLLVLGFQTGHAVGVMVSGESGQGALTAVCKNGVLGWLSVDEGDSRLDRHAACPVCLGLPDTVPAAQGTACVRAALASCGAVPTADREPAAAERELGPPPRAPPAC
ncbi:MAG: hypothetical protein AAGA11_06610 [Pseudomonadota bacterium]